MVLITCPYNSPLLVQTVASKLHGTDVEVEILKTKKECDHVQFLITELSCPGKASRPEAAQIETLSIGNLQLIPINTCSCNVINMTSVQCNIPFLY
jgi:hypothetical protein